MKINNSISLKEIYEHQTLLKKEQRELIFTPSGYNNNSIIFQIQKSLEELDAISTNSLSIDQIVLPKEQRKSLDLYISKTTSALKNNEKPPILILTGISNNIISKSVLKKLSLNQDDVDIVSTYTSAKEMWERGNRPVILNTQELTDSMFKKQTRSLISFFKENVIFISLTEVDYEEVREEIITSILHSFDYQGEVDYSCFKFVDTNPEIIRNYISQAYFDAFSSNQVFCSKHLNDTLRRAKIDSTNTDLARAVEPKMSLDQLILPMNLKSKIQEVVDYSSSKVINYDFAKRLSLGKKNIALFSGPPGTGKTMSAEVIAKSLNKTLWIADYSSLQSAYVGETEKNLTKLFKLAKRAEAVLLIDEADSLISSRENQTASFRVSQANHLLNLIDNFEGTLFLTTNFAEKLDKALSRRINFKINFTLPGKEEQIGILKSLLEPDCPLDVNFSYDECLGQQGLTGALIKLSVEKLIMWLSKNTKQKVSTTLMKGIIEDVMKQEGVINKAERRIGI